MNKIYSNKFLQTKDLSTAAIFASLLAIMAQISIPLPFTPVPISCNMIAIYMAGIFLRPKIAMLSQIVYLLLGTLGIPVFANFKAGIGVLFDPTGGYIFSYPIIAIFISSFLSLFKSKNIRKNSFIFSIYAFFVLVMALIICYFMGSLWLSFIMKVSIYDALKLSVYPYIPIDILKILFCIIVILPLKENFKRPI